MADDDRRRTDVEARPGRRRVPPVAAAAALLALALAACGDGTEGRTADPGDAADDGRPVVVVSVPPLAWFVERLAGERVDVVVMVPPGASPATHEPTTRQMRAVARADLYVAVGHAAFPFEAAWMDALTDANPGMEVVAAAEGCHTVPDDPHVWLSTWCARRMAASIGGAVRRALGAEIGGPDGRTRSLAASIDSVRTEMARRLAPHSGRSFLVFHPALGYLAREFGLRQTAVAGGPSGPGAAELGEIVTRARKAGIQTVFVQPQFSREAAGVVAAELPGGRVETLDPLARDWASAMVEIAGRLAAAFESRGATSDARPAAADGGAPAP